MFEINEDKTINITRGDIGAFTVNALNEAGENYIFQKGDVVRIKVTEKKACENVMFQKDFVVTEETEQVEILLTEEDTKIGEVISKPTDYWYEIELNPLTNPQTIIGYDEDGAKILRLYPEGNDIEPVEPTPEDIPVVDEELDITSERPVQNQAITRAMLNLQEEIERVENNNNITSDDLEPLAVGIEENKSNIAKNTGSIEDLTNTLDTHTADKNNPHNVTADQVSIDGYSANNVQGAIDDVVRTIGYVKSKNLLVVPYIDFNKTENGVTWVINSDYSVTGTGASTVSENEFLCSQRQHQPLTLKAGTYILSGSPKGGSDSSYYMKIGKTASNGNYELMGKDYGDGFIFTLTEETKLSISCDLVQGYKATDITFYPMVRYASIEDDTYKPYVEDVQTRVDRLYDVEKIWFHDSFTTPTTFKEYYTYTAKKKCIINLTYNAIYNNQPPQHSRINVGSITVSEINDTNPSSHHLLPLNCILNAGDVVKCLSVYKGESSNQIRVVGYVQYLE